MIHATIYRVTGHEPRAGATDEEVLDEQFEKVGCVAEHDIEGVIVALSRWCFINNEQLEAENGHVHVCLSYGRGHQDAPDESTMREEAGVGEGVGSASGDT